MNNCKIFLSIFFIIIASNEVLSQFPRVASNIGFNANIVKYEGTTDGPNGGFDIEGYGVSKRISAGAFIDFDVELDVRSVVGGGGFFNFQRFEVTNTPNTDIPSGSTFGLNDYGPHLYYTFKLVFREEVIDAIAQGSEIQGNYDWFSLTAGAKYNFFDNRQIEEFNFINENEEATGANLLSLEDSGISAFARLNFEFNIWTDATKGKVFVQYEKLLGNRFSVVSTNENVTYSAISFGITWLNLFNGY